MAEVKELYSKMLEEMQKENKNKYSLPHIQKVVINSGVGNGSKDPSTLEAVTEILKQITGQKPVLTKSKLSISNFGVKEGDILGVMVTLRNKNMWSFIEKFVSLVLPRFKDFRGLKNSCVDQNGNLHIGVVDHTAFLEIDTTKVEKSRSLQVSFVVGRSDRNDAIKLYKGMGIPFLD